MNEVEQEILDFLNGLAVSIKIEIGVELFAARCEYMNINKVAFDLVVKNSKREYLTISYYRDINEFDVKGYSLFGISAFEEHSNNFNDIKNILLTKYDDMKRRLTYFLKIND